MPYRLPTFNLTCNIGPSSGEEGDWPASPYVGAPRLADQECALVFGRRVSAAFEVAEIAYGVPGLCMWLLLPAGTDIRSFQSLDGIPDTVEVPAGSGRWYGVAGVDDIGKGYPNEHRTALLESIPGRWAVPYP